MRPATSVKSSLFASALAAIAASLCCIGPLVLVMLGIGGAWVSNLRVLEPWRPLFIGFTALFLILAFRKIWRPASACAPGAVCALPQVNRGYKFLFGVIALLIAALLAFPLAAPWFY